MTDPVFPAGYTQGLVPGMVPNAHGTLPSIQDYLTFVYTQNSEFLVEKALGGLGESLIVYKSLTQALNQIYALATNPAVVVDRTGTPTGGEPNTTIEAAATAALFQGANSISTQLSNALAAVGDQIPPSTMGKLTQVSDDLYSKAQNFGGWQTWYGSVDIQDHLLTALTAVQSLNNIAQARFTEIMFIYETFVKGASAILSGYGQVLEDVAINIRQN